MADSKISSLPLSPYVLDKDLMVIVTGHLEEGAYPHNVKIPVSYIRRYIVRLNLLSNPQSGIGNYYNSGLNILTTWTTGIHAVPGNNIEVEFSANTPAGQKYGRTGGTSHSGIISTIGLNAKTENLIVKDLETSWPYSGIIYNTGLNAVAGNNIEINFSTSGNSHGVYGGAGGKYQSGIISVTGSNIVDGSGIGYTIEPTWPYKFNIFTTDKVRTGNSQTIYNNNSDLFSATSGLYKLLDLNYNDFYFSKTNQTLKLLGTAAFKISNIVFDNPPYVPGVGSLNTRKIQELLSVNGVTYPFQYATCDNYPTPTQQNSSHTFTTGDFISFEPLSHVYIANTFTLTIGISGGNSNGFISNIHSYPITFRNVNGPNSNECSEIYRSGAGYNIFNGINSIDPIIIQEPVTLNINSASINAYNSLALCASITNVQYSRLYRYLLAQSNDCFNINNIYYTFNTNNTYTSTSASIDTKFIKAENIVE